MATPGYPQMQQNPMMGGPQFPPRPVKRGVSKAVPVVVSAGLAVGVFCGLLFGLGTGDPTASAAPAKGNNVHPTTEEPAPTTAPPAAPPPKAGSAATAATSTGSGSASNPVAASGSAAGSAAGSGAGSGSAVAAKAVDTAKLTIEVEPAAAAAVAKIQIDGKDITGTSIDLPADKKSVKVSVTATGYHSVDKKVDVTGGSETKVQLELTKRATGGSSPGFGGASTGGNHVPVAPPKPKKPSNNGIIDI